MAYDLNQIAPCLSADMVQGQNYSVSFNLSILQGTSANFAIFSDLAQAVDMDLSPGRASGI